MVSYHSIVNLIELIPPSIQQHYPSTNSKKMASKKISKPAGQVPSDLENEVAKALVDLEITAKDLRLV